MMFLMIIFVWFLFVGSNTLAEALRFSPWKGLASLALVIAVPLVLTAAAVIAFQIT